MLHSAFPEDGDQEYRVQGKSCDLHMTSGRTYYVHFAETMVLEKLGLPHLSRGGEASPHPPATPTIQSESPRAEQPAPSPHRSPTHTILSPPPSVLSQDSSSGAQPCVVDPSQSSSHAPKISQSSSHTVNVSLSTVLSQLRNKRPNKDGESVQPKRVALSPSNTKQ